MCFIMKTLLEARIRTKKKMFNKTEFNQSQWLKPYVEFNEKQKQKKIETKMNKCCKNLCTTLYMKKTMGNLKTRIDKTK